MNDKLNHSYIAGTGTPLLSHGLSVKLAHARVAIVLYIAAPLAVKIMVSSQAGPTSANGGRVG